MSNSKTNLLKTIQGKTKMTKKKDINPKLQLSMQDKVYLAVAQSQADKLVFIHALVCRREFGGTYKLLPEEEIMTFTSRSDAGIYYQTLLQIQKVQQQSTVSALFDYNKEAIAKFNSCER